MDISVSLEELKLFRKMSQVATGLGMELYVVGGFVRDKLLGRDTKDIDFVTVGDGIFLAEAIAKSLKGASEVTVFKTYGTAYFRYQELDLEFVGARRESYTSDSRNPQVDPGTLIEDQNRRDFTINALAMSLNQENFGRLIDPFDGVKDLNNKIIRTPLDPTKTFSDDPLRILRAFRFSNQLNFAIDSQTLDAIKNEKERVHIISGERIVDELNKIMMCDKPSMGLLQMYDIGLLQLILPEVTDLAGVDYVNGKGHKDNFYHSLEVLDNLCAKSNNLWLRWAALLHDIGKTPTKKFDEKLGWTFHAHDIIGGRMVVKIFRRLKFPLNEKMKYVKKLVELHLRPISLSQEHITDSAVRRLLFDTGDDIDDLMTLCESDITSKNEKKVVKFLQNFNSVRSKLKSVEEKDRIKNWQPPIDGTTIMEMYKLKPGREVGILKDAIREAILDNQIDNDKDQAMSFLKQKAEEMGLTLLIKQ